MFLIGPDVIAELAMGDRCDAGVAAWYAGVDEADLYLSVVVTGEVRRVIELARFRDRQRAVALERWLHEVERGFGDRVLPVDARVADAWGKINAIGPIPAVDGLLAATATTYDLTLVVRDAEQGRGTRRRGVQSVRVVTGAAPLRVRIPAARTHGCRATGGRLRCKTAGHRGLRSLPCRFQEGPEQSCAELQSI